MAEFMLVPVSIEDAEAAGITEGAAIESYMNDRNEIVVRALTDIDGYVCDFRCRECPLDPVRCGRTKRQEPYVCCGRAVHPQRR